MKERKPIERAIAKQELERINSILRKPHLLIGGLAVQQYHSARISQDIDLVCEFEVAQQILKQLYPTKDWKVEDSRNDEYRPSFQIRHKVDKLGTIIFGPKISEREPYSHLDWDKLKIGAKPFKFINTELKKILVPSAHALAYAKMISFLSRQNPESKVEADLQDFGDLTNHEEFSSTLFYDLLRQSRAADELISTFRKKAKSFPNISEISCLHSLSKLYQSSMPQLARISPRTPKTTVYVAAPHKNVAKNNKIKKTLTKSGFVVKLPYDEVAKNGLKDADKIRKKCISSIDTSDILIVDLDTYGLDTAWEIGYAEGLQIKVIGYNEDIFMTTDERHINRRLYIENFMHGWQTQLVYNHIDEVTKAITGKKVYICGSFSRPSFDKKTKDALAQAAIKVVYPKDYVIQQKSMPRDYPLADRSETNKLLEEADTILVQLPRYGMDSSWQIGYATALHKEIIGWMLDDDNNKFAKQSFWDHWMHAWKSKLHVVGIRDLTAVLSGFMVHRKVN